MTAGDYSPQGSKEFRQVVQSRKTLHTHFPGRYIVFTRENTGVFTVLEHDEDLLEANKKKWHLEGLDKYKGVKLEIDWIEKSVDALELAPLIQMRVAQ